MCEWYGGDECATVYRETERKARKPHCCDGCGGLIAVGETYTYFSGIYDSRPFYGHACAKCTVALDAFADLHDGSPAYESLFEALEECIDEDGPTSWAVPHLEAMKARREAHLGTVAR